MYLGGDHLQTTDIAIESSTQGIEKKSFLDQDTRRGFIIKLTLLAGGTLSGLCGGITMLNFLRKPEVVGEHSDYFVERGEIEGIINAITDTNVTHIAQEILEMLPEGFITKSPGEGEFASHAGYRETHNGYDLGGIDNYTVREIPEASYPLTHLLLGKRQGGEEFYVTVSRKDVEKGSINLHGKDTILLGDSMTAPWGVAHDDGIPGLIAGGSGLTLAVTGHGTAQQLDRFQGYLEICRQQGVSTEGKVALFFAHPNDEIDDAEKVLFKSLSPRSYGGEFQKKFGKLIQAARNANHPGMDFMRREPPAEGETPEVIEIGPHQYKIDYLRYVPAASLNGFSENPILCDDGLNYLPGKLKDVLEKQGFDADKVVIDPLNAQVFVKNDAGALTPTGIFMYGGVNPHERTASLMKQMQDLAKQAGMDFAAFTIYTFEEHAADSLGFEKVLDGVSKTTGADPIDLAISRGLLTNRARQKGVTLYNLAPGVKAMYKVLEPSGKLLYYIHDGHHTVAGHQVASAAAMNTMRINRPALYAKIKASKA